MRLLITNDDGIEGPGIAALAQAAVSLGAEVVVAAPAWNSSGASASITGVSDDNRLVFDDRTGDFPGTAAALAVESSPAMIVRVGLRGAFGPPPDLVLSGINDGPNTGHAVLHSGTVGAALTAATHGCRSVAFSLGIAQKPDFEAAASIAPGIIEWALNAPAPLTLNVNVPSGPLSEVRGIREAPLADFGAVQTQVTEKGQGFVNLVFESLEPDDDPSSDAALLAAGFATVTALSPVCQASSIDLSGLLREASGALA